MKARRRRRRRVLRRCRLVAFLFYRIIEFTILEGIHEVVRRVLRRGKALVRGAYIAASNEHNEHGSFVPERRHPFRGSSSDVHQVVFRCNGDVQIKDRAVPTDAVAHSNDGTEPATSAPNDTGGLVFGSRSFSPLKKR